MNKFLMTLIGFTVSSATAVITVSSAYAHIVVAPNEVITAGYYTFTMSVPNEKPVATKSVRLSMPQGLSDVTPTQKPDWNITAGKTSNGMIDSITWSGEIPPDMRDDFTFSAKVPDLPGELDWKAYQTYEDGTIVSWDKLGDSEAETNSSGPFSVTKVTSVSSQTSTADEASKTAHDSGDWSRRAFYVAAASLLISLLTFGVSIRRR